jgi:Right handed beta helix region
MGVKYPDSRLGVVALIMLGMGALAASAWAAAPTPIASCPYTISNSGNYAVTKDLSSTGTCITIGNPGNPVYNMAIDLQGHSITGNGSGFGIAEGTPSNQRIIVVNGTLKRFGVGINMPSTQYLTVSMMDVVQNSGDGIDAAGQYATVVETQATNNGVDGVHMSGPNAKIINCQANNNGQNGIYVGDQNAMVIDSIADNNMNNGMYFPEVFATVVNSTARNNGYGGIFLDNYLESAINNVANKNGSVGIEISTGEANSLVVRT